MSIFIIESEEKFIGIFSAYKTGDYKVDGKIETLVNITNDFILKVNEDHLPDYSMKIYKDALKQLLDKFLDVLLISVYEADPNSPSKYAIQLIDFYKPQVERAKKYYL